MPDEQTLLIEAKGHFTYSVASEMNAARELAEMELLRRNLDRTIKKPGGAVERMSDPETYPTDPEPTRVDVAVAPRLRFTVTYTQADTTEVARFLVLNRGKPFVFLYAWSTPSARGTSSSSGSGSTEGWPARGRTAHTGT